jgi:hypothetical protein
MSTKSRSPKKTTGKARLSDAPVGSLVRQRNGGALRNGGTNRGGTGRPPEAIRASIRDSLDALLPTVLEIAYDTDATATDRLRAIEFHARYGLGTADSDRLTVFEGGRLPGVIVLPAELPDV